ncbi:MAG TPA: Trk system potassium transporter TrkA [Gammaproteobacteria bacterium]|nr:Trk system potassium transporter TrkA [Gammaproteobacteria bacterium]
MKIIILGAGQVGSTLAHHLANESNDITIVDASPMVLRDLQDRMDLRGVVGLGSHPDILEQAGANDADMLIAVTNSDETNMVACQVAYTLFHTPTKIARVRDGSYLDHSELFSLKAMPVDVLISPEALVTEYIHRLIRHPGALQVLDFANGRLQLVVVKAQEGGALVGEELRSLNEHMPGIHTRVTAIFRGDKPIKPVGDTIIEIDDEVFFIASPSAIRAVTSELRKLDKPYKRIMIAGGGNIGMRLAERLENKYQVKLIERDAAHSRQIAEELGHVIVFHGDAADEDLLNEENIEGMDVFVALTNDDEANILSAMLAKRLGARKVMSLVNRPSYSQLVESGIVDIAISPQQITLSGLLRHVRRGDVVAVHSLRHGAAEAIEAIAHGDKRTSKVVGRRIDELKLPEDIRVSVLVRGEQVIFVHHDTRIEAEDHVILFVANKRRIPDVERLFQVSATFL